MCGTVKQEPSLSLDRLLAVTLDHNLVVVTNFLVRQLEDWAANFVAILIKLEKELFIPLLVAEIMREPIVRYGSKSETSGFEVVEFFRVFRNFYELYILFFVVIESMRHEKTIVFICVSAPTSDSDIYLYSVRSEFLES